MPQKSKLIPQAFIPFSARLMAALRAKESQRSDRLFFDPFAVQLAGKDALEFAENHSQPRDIAYLALRTKFFDDFFQERIGGIYQIVLLAAGMDTRAYRLSWPENTHLYELDFAGILDYKERILQGVLPQCQRIAIAADLTQPWTHLLFARGYQRERPSIWLLEGLLMYLQASQCDRLMQDITDLTASGSYLGLDAIDSKALKEDRKNDGYFQFGIDDPEAFLAQYSWTAKIRELSDLALELGRFQNLFPPHKIPNTPRAFPIAAHK